MLTEKIAKLTAENLTLKARLGIKDREYMEQKVSIDKGRKVTKRGKEVEL